MTGGEGGGEPRSVSADGFRWLLKETYGQLWTLLREYVANAEKRSGGYTAAPAFLSVEKLCPDRHLQAVIGASPLPSWV